MSNHQTIVAVYDSNAHVEQVVGALCQVGYDMRAISVIGRDVQTETQVMGYQSSGDHVGYWGATGSFWGGLWGMLFGSAYLCFVPGIGPLMIGGPIIAPAIEALEERLTADGLSALGTGMVRLGLPHECVENYESAFRNGKFLVLVHGDQIESNRARVVLSLTQPDSLDAHQLVPNLFIPTKIHNGSVYHQNEKYS